MGLLLYRAKETVSGTPGTGAVTPGGASGAFRTFAAAGAVAGFWYDVLYEDGTAWESGAAFYNGTTLTRGGPGVDPQFRSSTGSLLSLSSSATVACVANENTLQAGGKFMPPLASYFPNTIGSTGAPVLTNSAINGLIYSYNASAVTGDKGRGAYKTITAVGNWQMVCRILPLWVASNWIYGSVFVGRAGTRNLIIGPISSPFSPNALNADATMSSNAGGAVGNAVAASIVVSPNWYRITYTSATSTILVETSYDNENWSTYLSQTTTALSFGGAPDKLGLAVSTNLASTIVPKVIVPYWWDNA